MKNIIGLFYGYYPHGEIVDWISLMKRAKAAGVGGVEVSATRLAAQGKEVQKDVAAAARDLAMDVSFCGALVPDGDISSPSASERQRGMEHLKRCLDVVQTMGGNSLNGNFHSNNILRENLLETLQERTERSKESISKLAQTAADCGVMLGMEACNRFDMTLLTTAREAVQYVRDIGHPNVGIHLDTFHMHMEEDDMVNAILSTKGYLVHFHVCENNRKLPGLGQIDWQSVLVALAAIGYQHRLGIESFCEPHPEITDKFRMFYSYVQEDPDTDLRNSVSYLRGIMANIPEA